MDGINSLLSEPGDWNSAGESRRWRTQSAVDCSLLLLLLPRNVVEALTLVEACRSSKHGLRLLWTS